MINKKNKQIDDIKLLDNFDYVAAGLGICGVILFIVIVTGGYQIMSKCNMCNHECHCREPEHHCQEHGCHCISCYCGGGDGGEQDDGTYKQRHYELKRTEPAQVKYAGITSK